MRFAKGVAGLASLAAVLAAFRVEAAPPVAPATTSGEWELTPGPGGACFVTRKYPTGTYLHLTASSRGSTFFSIGNGRFNLFVFGSYKMSLIVGGERRPIDLGGNGRSYNAGLSLSAGSDVIAQLRRASAIELDRPDGAPLERLDLGGLAPALARLPDCIAKAAATRPSGPVPGPPAPPSPAQAAPRPETGKARPPRPRLAFSQLFQDYPAAALRAGEEGLTEFRLQIDVQGRVTGCAITRSSRSATLDSETCRVLVARGRFHPALDADGKPTPAESSGRVAWRLPLPPDPPPPPVAR